MNKIYNSHFSGSPVWDLFSHEAFMLENTWNKSMRLTFDLPLQAHKYLLCPLSESVHIKNILISRFISFTQKIEASKKKSVTHLYKSVKNDVRSITGSNLRNIVLLLGQDDDFKPTPIDSRSIKYHPVQHDDLWKIDCLKELIEVQHGDLSLDFDRNEIEEMISFLSIS